MVVTEEGKYFFVHKIVPENTQKKTSHATQTRIISHAQQSTISTENVITSHARWSTVSTGNVVRTSSPISRPRQFFPHPWTGA